jgi:RNA polymerase sigma factor (TIGR02999 family)
LPLVYDELRRVAAEKLAQERPGQTLQATALVHEAYLRLLGTPSDSTPSAEGEGAMHWNSRGHFIAAAAEAMRRILIENARRKHSRKRGGDRVRQDLDILDLAAPQTSEDVLALTRPAEAGRQRQGCGRRVHLRLCRPSLPEVARLLGISPRTADRLWRTRAWLHQEIQRTARDIS